MSETIKYSEKHIFLKINYKRAIIAIFSVVIFFVSILNSFSFEKGNHTVFDEDYYTALIENIEFSKKNIHIIHFCFNLNGQRGKSVLKCLEKALERGVEVSIFTEGDKKGLGDRNRECADKLVKKGARVWYDSEKMVTHAKMFIFDKRVVLAGSSNLTESSIRDNRESNLLIDDSKIAIGLVKYFDTLVRNSSQNVNMQVNNNSKIVFFTDSLFSEKVIDLIDSAKKEISIMTYYFDFSKYGGNKRGPLDKMFEALGRAATRGCDIKLLLESSNRHFNKHVHWKNRGSVYGLIKKYPALKKSLSKGLFRYEEPERISHSKILVVDSQKAIMGSTNWYWKGVTFSHQINFSVENINVVNELERYYNRVFKKSKKF